MNKKKKNCFIDIYNTENTFDFFKPIYTEDFIDTKIMFENLEKKPEAMQKITKGSPSSAIKKENSRPSMHLIATLMVKKLNLLHFNGLIFIYKSGIYVRLTLEMIIEFTQTNLDKSWLNNMNYRTLEDVFKYLKGLNLPRLEFTIRAPIFAWNNGFIDLLSREQHELSPCHPLFSKVAINSYPGLNKKSEKFIKTLEQISGGDPQIIQRILEFMGYCLLSDSVGKYFFVLGTAKESGKSKIIAALLERLIGNDFISSTSIDDLGGNFGLASIVGKRLNLSLDLPSCKLNSKSVSRIKMLTGGDLVEINEKYMPQISYRNTSTFIFGTNFPINIKGDDDAFWERLIVIPFLYSIPKNLQNDNLIEELWQERDGIVSMALKAVTTVIQNNLQFSPCMAADNMVESWRDDMTDNVVRFIKGQCIFDENTRTHSTKLYEKYFDWCHENTEIPKSENYFSRILVSKFKLVGFRWKNIEGESLRGFKGIALK